MKGNGTALVPREAPRGSPSQRSETLSLVSHARGARCEELVAIDPDGVSFATWPIAELAEPQVEDLAARLLEACMDEAIERPTGTRHTYRIVARRDGREIAKGSLRLPGGAQNATGREWQAHDAGSPTTRMLMRHVEGLTSTFVRGHDAVIQSLEREVRRQAERIEHLEAQLDQARAKADEHAHVSALAESEKARTRAFAHLAHQLIELLPGVVKSWGVKLTGNEAAPEKVRTALGSINDQQRTTLETILDGAQLAVIDQARGGAPLLMRELLPFERLTDQQLMGVWNALREDQIMPLIEAIDAYKAGAPTPSSRAGPEAAPAEGASSAGTSAPEKAPA